jgi:soluble lytic murein transglycosylase-like protein
VLFLLVAILVGGGLLLIVPNLSASSGTETIPPAEPQSDTQVAEQPAESELVLTIEGAAQPDAAATGISPIFTSEVQYWAPKILEWSQLYGLDPDIIAIIMQIESCGDSGAASHVGAQGLFQVMPFHFDPGEDMLDPDTNARRGMAFYNRQLEYTGHDIYLSFAGYNGGYAASGSSYPYWANETQRYYTWAKGIYDEVKSGMATSPTLEQWLAAGGSGGCQRASQRIGL